MTACQPVPLVNKQGGGHTGGWECFSCFDSNFKNPLAKKKTQIQNKSQSDTGILFS